MPAGELPPEAIMPPISARLLKLTANFATRAGAAVLKIPAPCDVGVAAAIV
jgi:hypothetical protein